MQDSPVPCEIVDEYAPDWSVPNDAALVVTHMHYRWEEISALRKIYEENQTPILILADGVLEYRNTWDNPKLANGAVYQPVIGHKLACIGRSQARMIEAWGNPGKCEVVGLPRLDSYLNTPPLPTQPNGPFRLLVATATTPAFTDVQRAQVVNSLSDLKQRFDRNPIVNGRSLEITWRLTDNLGDEIGLEHDERSNSSLLSDAIDLADAVITTPSTLALESALKLRPTATLDYSNTPEYVPTAWRITAPAHINPVLNELAHPPVSKLQFQNITLADQLAPGPAQPRLYALISAMAEAGEKAKANQAKLELPARILEDLDRGFQKVETHFDLHRLYSHDPVYRINDHLSLQAELNHAIARLGQLPAELDARDSEIKKHEETFKLFTECKQREEHLAELLEDNRAALKKKSAHIEEVSQLFIEANQRAKNLAGRLQEKTEIANDLEQEVLILKDELERIRKQAGIPAAPVEIEEGPRIIKFPDPNRAA